MTLIEERGPLPLVLVNISLLLIILSVLKKKSKGRVKVPAFISVKCNNLRVFAYQRPLIKISIWRKRCSGGGVILIDRRAGVKSFITPVIVSADYSSYRSFYIVSAADSGGISSSLSTLYLRLYVMKLLSLCRYWVPNFKVTYL